MVRFSFLKPLILLLAASPILFFFQNCSQLKSELSVLESNLSSTADDAKIYLSTISMTDVGGISIKNKFGYIDGPVHGGGLDDSNHLARYQKLDQEVAPGLRIYNFWWASVEPTIASAGATPQYVAAKTPHECPAGAELYPKQNQSLGSFHFYRCVNKGELAKFKKIFQYDQSDRVIPIVTLYGTPLQYRGTDCQQGNDGFLNIQGVMVHPWGCPPVDLRHFEDYVRIMAKEFGFIKHWNIWNENNSDTWFHMSPEITSSRAQHLGNMMNIVNRIFKEESLSNFRLYMSLDLHWQSAPNPQSVGSMELLDGLWNVVSSDVPWSLNLHPYTDEHAVNPAGFPIDDRYHSASYYGFGNLDKVIQFQRTKLQQKGISNNTAPQLYALLGEQGWYMTNANKRSIAIEICKAQDIMNKNPFILGATYNTLFVQGTGDQDGLGLLPQNILNSIGQANAEPTYQAMLSTHPNRWGKTADHFCCTQAQVGCGTSTPKITYSWSTGQFGSCSANPSYSYSAWSACTNGSQTRTASCVNTSGTKTRAVSCVGSDGQTVADSFCSGSKPAASESCTATCSGQMLTQQSCTNQNSYSWSTGQFGSCSASPSYSYSAWSACTNGSQTRTASCVNTAGTKTRTVTCTNGSGQTVADSFCTMSKPTVSEFCVSSCTGSAVTTQSCTSTPAPSPTPTPGPISNSNIQSVRASVGGVSGQTGRWWCQSHFGRNLGGGWICISGNCDTDAYYNQEFTCEKRYAVADRVTAVVGGVSGQTGSWWCQNHFGNNLGGAWDCIGSRCSQDAVRGEVFDCGRR